MRAFQTMGDPRNGVVYGHGDGTSSFDRDDLHALDKELPVRMPRRISTNKSSYPVLMRHRISGNFRRREEYPVRRYGP